MPRSDAPLHRKLVVVLKGYPRLSETFIAQELLGLENAGIELVIVSLRHPTDITHHAVHDEIQAPVLYLPEYLHNEPLRVLQALLVCLRKPGFINACKAFLPHLRQDLTRNRLRRFGQAMVLAAQWPSGGFWLHAHFIHTPASVADYASRILDIPWTVSAHAKDIWTSPDWELAGKLSTARWAVTCTGVGHRHLQSLAADASCVHLSYHGLDLERFPPFERALTVLDGQQADNPVTILSVGRAVKKKGFDVLLNALAALPPELHWRFLHIGGGTELQRLTRLATTLGINQNITWLGAMDQAAVLQHYRSADVFALACKITDDGDRDGLPNVLVEAASQGLACISTTISGIPELFIDQHNGLLVEPEDPQAMAEALRQAICTPSLRHRLGKAAQEQVRSTFDYHVSIRQLVNLFQAQWDKTN
ncbi:MAG: glycosyltransferase family 4 protein [Granulosicoccus sp.]